MKAWLFRDKGAHEKCVSVIKSFASLSYMLNSNKRKKPKQTNQKSKKQKKWHRHSQKMSQSNKHPNEEVVETVGCPGQTGDVHPSCRGCWFSFSVLRAHQCHRYVGADVHLGSMSSFFGRLRQSSLKLYKQFSDRSKAWASFNRF